MILIGQTISTISKESIRIIFHTATNVTSFVTSELSPRRGILKLHATEQGKKVSRNNIIASSHVKLIISFLTPPSDNSSLDGEIDDDDNNNSSSSEDSSNMVKSKATTTSKTTTKKKKAEPKTTGLSDDDGPTKKKTKVVEAKLYSIDVVKPYTQQEYAKDTDDIIDVVLVVDGVPNKKAEPEVTLESDGMKLKVLWKTPNVVLSVMQAKAQGIAKDSTHYQAYDNTMQQMYNHGIRPSNGYIISPPQYIPLKAKCVNVTKIERKVYEVGAYKHNGYTHTQFSSMYVVKLRVDKIRVGMAESVQDGGIVSFGFSQNSAGSGGYSGGRGGGGGGARSTRSMKKGFVDGSDDDGDDDN